MALSAAVRNALRAVMPRVFAEEMADQIDKLEDHSQAELDFLDGVTAGTAAAGKAVVLDANKDIATIRHATISGNIVHGSTSLSETDTAKIDGITNGTQAAGKAVVADANVNTGVSKITELHIGTSGSETQVTATAAELNQLDGNILADMTPGSGISTATNAICEHRVSKVGGLIKTEILIDLTDLADDDVTGDIIGKPDDTANCHIGRILAAVNGTIVAGRVTCFETPATGDPDIDIWYADENTGAQGTLITGLTGETQMINHGDWTAEDLDYLTAFPAADKYMYLTVGAGTPDNGTYTAGILLIELWGVPV